MVRLNVRHAHKPTHTQASTHAQISWQLLGLFWVWMLALGTLARGEVREVYVRLGYTFSFCLHCVLLIETTISLACADACAQTRFQQTRHTHVYMHEMCVYRSLLLESTPLIYWHGRWLLLTQRFSLKCLYVNSETDTRLPYCRVDVCSEIILTTSSKTVCTYLSSCLYVLGYVSVTCL